MSNLLQASQLTKSYGNFTALDHFDIQIPEGAIYGLLGPNGAGKTTFLRIVNQITAADSGSVRFMGETLQPKHIAKIGYMPEERGLYKKMKVGEQAMYFARLKGLNAAEAKKKATYWFDRLGIMSWWKKPLTELSKGMGQKVQFVITVLHDPDFLIFDEPFSGFDPVNAQLIGNEILELKKQGKSILFSTHRMESVEQMCDDVALIHQSKKILDGPIQNIRNQYKKGKYELVVKPQDETAIEWLKQSKWGTINDLTQQENTWNFQLKIDPEISPNKVLADLLPHYEILKFQEHVPSMNDVFLEAVSS